MWCLLHTCVGSLLPAVSWLVHVPVAIGAHLGTLTLSSNQPKGPVMHAHCILFLLHFVLLICIFEVHLVTPCCICAGCPCFYNQSYFKLEKSPACKGGTPFYHKAASVKGGLYGLLWTRRIGVACMVCAGRDAGPSIISPGPRPAAAASST